MQVNNSFSFTDQNLTLLLETNIINFNLFELFVIIFSSFVFVLGIVGNLLVVIVVLKNSHMKTITNMFIVNLAIGDFLVILICLPTSVLQDVTGQLNATKNKSFTEVLLPFLKNEPRIKIFHTKIFHVFILVFLCV